MAYWSRLAQSQLTHQWRRRCFHTSSYAFSIIYPANNSSSAFALGDRLSGTTVKADEFSYNARFFFTRSYSQCVALPSSKKYEDQEDLGAVLTSIMDLLEDVAIVESGPLLERKLAYAIVRHVKFGPSKKGTKKVKDATNVRPTGKAGVSGEGAAETDTEAEDGFISDEDDGLDEIAVHPAAPAGGRAPYCSAPNSPNYSEPNRSEATVRIPPSMPEPPQPSENRYKKPGPANNNHFRPPFTDNRRPPQEGGSFRPQRQFPSDRNQQQPSDLNIPPGVRRPDPSGPGTKVPGFGIFSSPKPGGPSEDNTKSSNNVGNRYGGARRF